MKTTAFGRTSIQVPRISLGGVLFGREIDEAASRLVLDQSLERGINLIDTAEAYGGGNSRAARRATYQVNDEREVSGEMHSSENIIGRWMKDRRIRDQVILCTKFSTGGRPADIHRSVEQSLARLQTDYIDVYMIHNPFKDVPIAETLEGLNAEVVAGRIRSIGASNFSADQLKEAHAASARLGFARMESVQPPLSLVDRRSQAHLLPYCVEQEVGTLAYSPLGAGFLTGKYSQGEIPKGTRFDISPAHADLYFSPANFQLVENLRTLSREIGEPMTKLAMSWVFQQAGVSSVLIGARHQGHLDTAVEALNWAMDPAILRRMNSWF